MFLHDTQELDNNLRAGPNKHLALPGLFGVVDGIERIVENTGFDHFDKILSSMAGDEVSSIAQGAKFELAI